MLAQAIGTEVVDLTSMEFPPELLSLVPPQTARLQGVLPLDFDGSVLRVVVVNPLDPNVVDNLRFATQKDIQLYVAPSAQVLTMIERFYGSEVSDMEDVLLNLAGEAAAKEGTGDVIDIEGASSAPIIKYVNTVLAQAIQARASDIHFEPFEHDFKIRYRVDGALYEMSPPPRSLATSVTSRIKVMSSMNIAERRIPQGWTYSDDDGRTPGRLARLDIADAVWRKRRFAGPGSDHSSIGVERDRHAESHLRLHLPRDRKAKWDLHRHRPDRLGQDDDLVCLLEPDQHR